VLRLTQNQVTFTNAQNELTMKMDFIFDQLHSLQLQSIQPSPPPPTPSHNHHNHHLKLEVPRIDGHDFMGWIFKISQFFYYYNTLNKKHITIALFYMDGPVLS